MSEFERFETRPQDDLQFLRVIADTFMPMDDAHPVVRPDESLCTVRVVSFDNGEDTGVMSRMLTEDGTERLTIVQLEFDSANERINTNKYHLILNSGLFLVERENLTFSEQRARMKEPESDEEINQQVTLQYELGMMKPEASDWEKFLRLFTAAESAHQNEQKQSRGSRLAKLLSVFRNK